MSTHTHTHVHAQMCTHTHTRAHTNVHTHTHTQMHTHTHIYTPHTHIQTHKHITHTNAYTHTLALMQAHHACMAHKQNKPPDRQTAVTDRLLPWTAGKEGLVADGVIEVGLQQVLAQARGRLVGHLHTVLQHCHREL